MRSYNFIFLSFVFTMFFNSCNTKKQESKDTNPLTIDNLYFGQKPPGLTPELFASEVISLNGRFEGAVSFSPDLDEIYFAAYYEGEETAIYFSKLEQNEWTPLKRANFTKGEKM